MFATLIKLLTFYIANKSLSSIKTNTFEIKESAANYAETRAIIVKNNLMHDLERVVGSFLGYLTILTSVVFAGFIGLLWIFFTAWDSPNRVYILGIMMLIPLIFGALIFAYIKKSWVEKPFMDESNYLIAKDWQIFRHGLEGSTDTSNEDNIKR
jgi:hypothetical protein